MPGTKPGRGSACFAAACGPCPVNTHGDGRSRREGTRAADTSREGSFLRSPRPLPAERPPLSARFRCEGRGVTGCVTALCVGDSRAGFPITSGPTLRFPVGSFRGVEVSVSPWREESAEVTPPAEAVGSGAGHSGCFLMIPRHLLDVSCKSVMETHFWCFGSFLLKALS